MSSYRAFSIWGIRVRIDRSWFIAFFLFAWTLSAGYFPMQVPDYSAFTYWFFGTLSALALFASVLAHELSHCVAAQRLGIAVRQITLFIFGGVSEMDQTHSNSPRTEFRITIAGPLASAGIGLLFLLLADLTQARVDRIILAAFQYLYSVNFLLAAFNLIPGFPLDGGRVLRSYLWHRTGNLGQATRTASRVGQAVAVGFMLLGTVSILMLQLIPGIWLLLIGMFLRKSAEAEYQSFRVRVGLENMTLRDIMLPAIAVNATTTISDFVRDYVFHYHYRVFPILENNRFAGMIDVRSIKHLPWSDWGIAMVSEFRLDSSDYTVLHPDMQASDALRELLASKQTQAPIVQNRFLLGFITREDLFKVVSLKDDLAA